MPEVPMVKLPAIASGNVIPPGVELAILKAKHEKRKARIQEIIGWIRWAITTLIALAALINSILARLGI